GVPGGRLLPQAAVRLRRPKPNQQRECDPGSGEHSLCCCSPRGPHSMSFDALVYQGLIGVSLAMYLWLLAAGLTIAFGVLGVVHFAHGSLYMLGGYFAFTFYLTLQMNFWLSLLLAAASGGVI